MSDATTSTVKRATRARKTTSALDQTMAQPLADTSLSSKALKPMEEVFAKLTVVIATAREEYEALQKQMLEVKEAWEKEQRSHKVQIAEINQQEELTRKREKEMYDYEISLAQKKAEDEFLEGKNKWEKELQARKEEIAKERQELEVLRRQVAGFEEEKERAVKQACAVLQKELNETYATEQRLREQEIKAEKELLTLKITNLTQENARQANEISALKKSLENATAQLKDIAVKVIESSGASKPQTPSEL